MAHILRVSDLAVVEPPEAQKIKEDFRRLYDSCRTQRFFFDHWWMKGIALTEGQHWLEEEIASESRGNRYIKALPVQYSDAGIDMVRATLNWTRPLVTDIAAMLRVATDGWRLQFDPDPRNFIGTADEVDVMRRVWYDWLTHPSVDLPSQADLMNDWRVQTGSGLLKIVPDRRNPYGYNLQHVPNDRIIWDPANTSPDPEGHFQWADCKAWPLEEVERRYGFRVPEEDRENLPTLGALQAFDQMMQQVRSLRPAGVGDSKTRGVLLTEYWREESGPDGKPVLRLSVLMHTGTGPNQCYVLWTGRDPVGFSRFLKLDFGRSVLSMWGVGVPHIVETPQRFDALLTTCILRCQLATAAPHWIYERGTVEDPATAFSPRVGSPIEWDSNNQRAREPHIIEPPDMPRITEKLMALMPRIARDMAHLPPVLSGIPSGSREAAEALRTRLAQAERPFNAIAERDSERYARFFTRFVRMLVEKAPVPVLLKAVGDDLIGVALEMAGRRPRMRSRVQVRVPRDAIQPRTPNERKREIMELVALRVMSLDEARFEIARVTGRPLTSIEEAAIANAERENIAFLNGARAYSDARAAAGEPWDIRATHGEPATIHIRMHEALITNRYRMHLPDSVVRELEIHRLDHIERQGDEAELMGAVSASAQGQLGAVDAVLQQSYGDVLPASPLQGSMAAPPAMPTDYERRDMERELETRTQA